MATTAYVAAEDVDTTQIIVKLAELITRARLYDGPANWLTAARIINNHRVEVFFTGANYQELRFSVSGFGNLVKISFDEAVAAIAT